MKPRLVIYGTRNGWVLEDAPDEDGYADSESVEDDDVLLLWAIADRLCVLGSRYDAARLFIGRKPGDKHHDLHPKPCAECACKCDPDETAGTVPVAYTNVTDDDWVTTHTVDKTPGIRQLYGAMEPDDA